ncbi:MAG TPA: hypothetical protein VG604_02855 [Candidatus Saccharimonadales bacterium]|nr:hypothetical protein [Candidatus Saccharimonadales bacterium]
MAISTLAERVYIDLDDLTEALQNAAPNSDVAKHCMAETERIQHQFPDLYAGYLASRTTKVMESKNLSDLS